MLSWFCCAAVLSRCRQDSCSTQPACPAPQLYSVRVGMADRSHELCALCLHRTRIRRSDEAGRSAVVSSKQCESALGGNVGSDKKRYEYADEREIRVQACAAQADQREQRADCPGNCPHGCRQVWH